MFLMECGIAVMWEPRLNICEYILIMGCSVKEKKSQCLSPPVFCLVRDVSITANFRRDVSCIDSLGLHSILPNVYSVLSDRLYHFASRRLGVFLLIGNDFSPSYSSCMLLPGKCHLLYLLQLC